MEWARFYVASDRWFVEAVECLILWKVKRDIRIGRDSSSEVVVSLGMNIYYLGYTTRWLVIVVYRVL